MKYDLVIVGAGPAGLMASVYAARYNLKTLVIGKLLGGVVGEVKDICNFPTYEKVDGIELIKGLSNQAKKLGVKIISEEVLELKNKNDFEVVTNKNKYLTKKIILATGLERRKLAIKREKELFGRGVHYCATCDAGFYRDKIVGVVGGGNSALSSALLLGQFAKKVYVIYRGDKFINGEPTLIDKVKKNRKIEVLFDSEIEELIGKEKLEKVKLKNGKKVVLDGVFIEIGGVPNLNLARMLKIKIEKNSIKVDERKKTNIDGVYAVGDITNSPMKQIITACADGAIAAQSVYKEM